MPSPLAWRQVPVAVFLARPTALYHSLGASERLPIVSTSEGRGGLQTVPALTGKIPRLRVAIRCSWLEVW